MSNLRNYVFKIFLILLFNVICSGAKAAGFQTVLSISPSSKECLVKPGKSTCDIKFSWSTFYNGGGQSGHTSTDKRIFKFNGKAVSSSSSGSYTARISEGVYNYRLYETGEGWPILYGSIIANIGDPVAKADTVTLNEDGTKNISVLSNDYHPNDKAFSIYDFPAKPSHGVISKNGVYVRYKPQLNYCGVDDFSYRVRASNGAISNKATVKVNVSCIDDPPEIDQGTNLSLETEYSTPVSFMLTVTDIDSSGSSLSWSLPESGSPSHGDVAGFGDGTDRSMIYSPEGGFYGRDSFSVQVSDGSTSREIKVEVLVNRLRIIYEYDVLGRVREVSDSFGLDKAYDYDPSGNRTSVVE